MKLVKLVNSKPIILSARNLPANVKQKIALNLAKLKETASNCKTRNCDLDSDSARLNTAKSDLSNRTRSRSRIILKKDPIHEKKLLRELTIFRREVEIRYRNSKMNKTYEYPRTRTDTENNLTYDDVRKLKEDILATMACKTYGNSPEREEKPKKLKVLKSLKSIYMNQRSTCNDLYLFTSLKKNINQQLHSISRKYKTSRDRDLDRPQTRSQLIKVTTSKDSDISDSKNSIESKIKKTPYIKKMILQKLMVNMPLGRTESRDEETKTNPSQTSSTKNPLALTNSIMKLNSNDISSRVTPIKSKMLVTPLGPNGEKLKSMGKLRIVLKAN